MGCGDTKLGQILPVRLFFSASYPFSVVPSPALLFALADCDREGPFGWCLYNLLGNFQGHLICLTGDSLNFSLCTYFYKGFFTSCDT